MLPLRASLGLLVVLAPALAGCSATTDPVAPAAPVAPPPPPVTSRPAVPAAPMYVHPVPVLTLEALEGAETARARAAFAPVPATVRECQAGTGQILRLRLVAGEGRAHYSVDPATSLGPQVRRCVLEALSTVDIEGISGDPSPSARPPGFTAQLKLEW